MAYNVHLSLNTDSLSTFKPRFGGVFFPGLKVAYTRAMPNPTADNTDDETYLTVADERLALAVETAYQGLVAGTLRTKHLKPERMALILVRIADGLLDGAGASG